METVDAYREILLKHSRHPSHAGDPSGFALQGSCKNPLCGDAVDVGVAVESGRIASLVIRASGCGISTASASMMTEVVEGLPVAEALRALELFSGALTGAAGAVVDQPSRLVTEDGSGAFVASSASSFSASSKPSLADERAWPEEIPMLKPFSRLRESPTRVPCALIGWFALKDALAKSNS